LNLDNKPYNVDRNEIVFLNSVDTSASDSRYLELDADAESLNNEYNRPKLNVGIHALTTCTSITALRYVCVVG
jgi:hypothetical protein